MGNAASENDRNAAGLGGGAGDEAAEAASFLHADAGLATRVELALACEGLADMDTFSKSDPFVVVSERRSASEPWQEVQRTEIVSNTLAPQFVTVIQTEYRFEEVQYLRFDVYDCDSAYSSSDATGLNLAQQDFLGSCETTLAGIFGSHQQVWNSRLQQRDGSFRGVIKVTGEELVNQNDLVTMQLRAQNLKKGGLGGINAFIVLSKLREDGSWVPVYKTEVRKSSSPAFSRIQGSIMEIANADEHRRLKFEVKSYNASGAHTVIGEATTSISDMRTMTPSTPLQLHVGGADAAGRHRGGARGEVFLSEFSVTPRPSFLDYVRGGTELNFIVAIDFTASNGPPVTPDSLHYVDPTGQRLNSYASAISAIGHVLEFYDTDKQFPLYGFGGKAPGAPASHCFALNGNEGAPEVNGVQGILSTYYQSLQLIQLAGPTIFTNVISQAAAIAASTPQTDTQRYFVLLLLTDGVLNDMDNTIDAIVNASGLPLSILIVGVGNADFSAMEFLDSDDELLQSRKDGRRAQRDIVQFVPMNKFGGTGPAASHALAKELLAEIPAQLVSYFQSVNVAPLPPRPGPNRLPSAPLLG